MATSAKVLMTPEAVLSFPALFVPRPPMPGSTGDAKYEATLVFAPGTDLKELREEATKVANEKFGGKLSALIQAGKFKTPFLTEEGVDAKDLKYPKGSIFIRAKAKTKPGVVSVHDKNTLISDPNIMYSGCIVRATVRPFTYDQSGNKGVAFGLNNICRIRDGVRIDGRKAAKDEFDSVEAPEELGDDTL